VKLGDFGLALNISAETTQITASLARYMSPEQIRESWSITAPTLLARVVMYRCSPAAAVQGEQQVQHDLPDHAARSAPALGAAPRRAGLARPHRAPRDAQGGASATTARRVRGRPDRRLARGLGEAKESFGDADKFTLLRSMRFFSAFTDQELWEW